MKNATNIISILLGLILVVFGLNKFLNFMPPLELAAPATEFMGALVKTGYIMAIVAIVEIVTGVLIATNKFRALALVVLFPIMLNAFLFHLFLDRGNIIPALLAILMNIYLLFANKNKFAELLKDKSGLPRLFLMTDISGG